ncbi:hypothetical protein Y032_0207g2027 [Ancylostoma ceylanicum]|uniref:Uncharacterized protein n=1 Tax=Ancylostoma ceylanicum TaxID=53326 RepID=A0A016SLS4_9BILA|nr:hypothetical protein Y032_0207g2027 [Ancylostoma ceylanicum]
MMCQGLTSAETPGYRSLGEKGPRQEPRTVENAEIRDHQWRRVVLAGTGVENVKDMGPPIQKGALVQYHGRLEDIGHPMEKGSQRSALWEALG